MSMKRQGIALTIKKDRGEKNVAKKESIMEEGLEVRYERYKGILKDLTIMSDVFMRNVFKKQECTMHQI